MKYYVKEHAEGYARIKAEDLTSWGELHGEPGFDNFAVRPLLEKALPKLYFETRPPRALEYGCGTGPGACFLASYGFRVDAWDLDPTAIELARKFAAQRGLQINFRVQDICALGNAECRYNLIVDSYCLQSVVLDRDRQLLYEAVRALLKSDGRYLIGTAVWREDREYGDQLFDSATGIAYEKMDSDWDRFEDAVQIEGQWYLPHRRHLKPAALRDEVESAGFKVLEQDGGHLVCQLKRVQ